MNENDDENEHYLQNENHSALSANIIHNVHNFTSRPRLHNYSVVAEIA